MSNTIDISVENNGTEVIIVSLERVGVDVGVGNVERSITVDFGSLPQNIYWDDIEDKPNFHAVATSGDYDDLENKPNLSGVATSGNYADLSGKPRINSVTLNGNKTSAQLGLATAAQGALADSAYQKPLDGIPASDMTVAVQSALRKAETALQEHQSLDGYATQTWVKDQGYLTEHQDISGKQDTLVSGTNIKTINGESILGSGNLVIEGGGTGDYPDLTNKPSINSVTLVGNKTSSDLGLQPTLTFDTEPIENSTNPVTSGGIYTSLEDLVSKLSVRYNSLFGGVIENLQESPATIGDPRYYYITDLFGYFEAFDITIPADGLVHIIQWNKRESVWDYKSVNVYSKGTTDGLLAEKADKVVGAARGNFAVFDSESNLADSGISAGDVATTSDIAGKLDAPSTAGTSGQVLTSDGQGGQSWQTPSGGGGTATDVQVNGTSITSNNVANIVTNTAYNASSNKIATMSDLPSVPVTDVTVGGTSVVSSGTAVIPAIPDVSGKADKVVYVDASTPPSTMDANKVYQYGTLSGNTTFPAFTAVSSGDTEVKIWCWTFTTPSTAPTITWPAGITAWNGGSAPTINASKNYEVSVMDGVACIVES